MARPASVKAATVALVPLDNDRWGFSTNCFVCERSNEAGLRIPFFHDTERELVVAHFRLDDRFSGAPTWLHGGIALAVCDEAMAWATIAMRHKWAVTKHSDTDFHRPLLVDHVYRCTARVINANDEDVETEAEITSVATEHKPERRCVQSRATMSIVTSVQAPEMGITLAGPDAGYVRDDAE